MIERQAAQRLDLKIRMEVGRVLRNAKPSPLRSHQLARTLKREVDGQFPWARLVKEYFEIPFEKRNPKCFDQHFGIRSYPWLYDQFILKLHHTQISETAVFKVASNFFKSASEVLPTPQGIFTSGIVHASIHKLLHPRYDRSFFSPTILDFVDVWEEVIISKFGSLYESYFKCLRQQLYLHIKRFQMDLPTEDISPAHGEDPSETELQWLLSLVRSLVKMKVPNGFPLEKGPTHRKVRTIYDLGRKNRIFAGYEIESPEDLRTILTESIVLLHRYKKIQLPAA